MSAPTRGPAICELCGKPGERIGDHISPAGWFFLAAKYDPDDGKSNDDRLIIHACSVECREALWAGKPGRSFSKTTFNEREQPKIYPCGCARAHVNRGLCVDFQPGELP